MTRHDDSVIDDGALVIHDGHVVEAGRFADLRRTFAGRYLDIDATVVPGMIDAHSHLRGVSLDRQGIGPRVLESWLCTLTAATVLPPGADAYIASRDLLGMGVTSVQAIVHVVADAGVLAETLASVAAAVGSAGLRALLVAGFTDQAELAPEPRGPEHAGVPQLSHAMDAEAYVEAVRGFGSTLEPRVETAAGPVAAQWCSDAALDAIATGIDGARLHTHLHESRAQRFWLGGQEPPLARLAARGMVSDRLSVAHATDLTTAELELLVSREVTLIHCPISNRLLETGDADVRAWLDAGASVALGLDSVGGCDIFDVMREVVETARRRGGVIAPAEVVGMATTGGAAALGDPRRGHLRPGAAADLIAIDDVAAVDDLVVSATASQVQRVWVGGDEVIFGGAEDERAHQELARLDSIVDSDEEARRRRLERVEAGLVDVVWPGEVAR